MYDTKLKVVNACIGTLGEAPLNSLDDEHQFKEQALDRLEGSLLACLKTGYWFNSEGILLQPQADSKFIMIPDDAIEIERVGQYFPEFGQRGNRLYDPVRNRFEWDHPMYVRLVRRLEFEDCPFFAQDSISLDAVLRFQQDFDGDSQRYQQINTDRGRAYIELKAQHVRHAQVNLLDQARAQSVRLGIHRQLPYFNSWGGGIPPNYHIS